MAQPVVEQRRAHRHREGADAPVGAIVGGGANNHGRAHWEDAARGRRADNVHAGVAGVSRTHGIVDHG